MRVFLIGCAIFILRQVNRSVVEIDGKCNDPWDKEKQ